MGAARPAGISAATTPAIAAIVATVMSDPIGIARSPAPSVTTVRTIAQPPDPQLDQLTSREREVLAAVAKGLSNAELADELFMSNATAKTHVSHLLTEFAVRDRAQFVVVAYETGLITPGLAK